MIFYGFIVVSIKSNRLRCIIFRNIVVYFDNFSFVLYFWDEYGL